MTFNFSIIALFVLVLSFSFLAYIYIGYPVIIIVVSKFFGKPVKRREYFPNVTIVIPAFNEESVIKEKIENTLEFDYPREKILIVVCDDASEDQTKEIVKSFSGKGVKLSEAPSRVGKVGGLNRAINQEKDDFFVITDADILPDKDALKELMFNFADREVGCVVAETRMMTQKQETGNSGGLYWRYEALIRKSESHVHSTVAATGHLMGIRKDILNPIPENIILDDFYLATMTMQKGYRVIFEPKSIAWERPTTSMKDEVNRRRRLTAGRYQILFLWKEYLSNLKGLLKFQVISHKFLRLTIPYFMILALGANVFLVIGGFLGEQTAHIPQQALGILLLLQAAFYVFALAGALVQSSGFKHSKIMKILAIPYYLCATNFSSILGLIWYLSGKRTVLWQQANRQ